MGVNTKRDVRESMPIDSPSYYASIVQSSDDAIYSKTLEGIIKSWNPGAEKIYGFSAIEVIGKPVNILIPPRSSNELPEILEKIKEGKYIDHYETKRIRKDGVIVDISMSVFPIRDEKNNIIGVSTIARDITGRIQASQYARSLVEASLDPLVTISPEGKITDVNEATIKATGISREKLIGTDFSDYFTEPEKARQGYQQVLKEGYVTDYSLTIRHRNGQLTDVLYNASVYKDVTGNVLGVFAAARDVTAQKKAEEEVAEQRKKELIKLAELERFQKLTVGRELKMIELKNEINELKSKLTTVSKN